MAHRGIKNDGSKLLEVLQNDFKNLSMETKKRYPQIKEASEEAIVKLRNSMSDNQQTPIYYVINQILYPIVQGCETKESKIVKMCLGMIQKLITYQAVDQKGARYITDTLWMLMESGTEQVKVLQSVTLLLTTNSIVHGETLARNLVLCFRLHFTKDSTIINTAGATVRQLVSLVFERVIHEDQQTDNSESNEQNHIEVNFDELKVLSSVSPKRLKPCAADAYLMFQDLVQLVNTDHPYWLIGMTEMTRTFGLELLESVLADFQSVFFKHPEFNFLLKERVCALVIKLFSPNIKYRMTGSGSVSSSNIQPHQVAPLDKPHFPITIRLIRVVSILIRKYHKLLTTECEIFLSLIVKFLDPDKPMWQRSVALEVLHRLIVEQDLLASFCACYDLKMHSTKIFHDIVNSLGNYVQSLFLNPSPMMINNIGNPSAQGQPPTVLAGMPVGPGVSPQPGFFFRGLWLPIVINFPTGQAKSIYLDMNDKIEPPPIPDGYGISVAYACLIDAVRAIQIEVQPDIISGENLDEVHIINTTAAPLTIINSGVTSITNETNGVIEPTVNKKIELHKQLIDSSWCGLLSAFSPLMESCTDESIMENILKSMQVYISLCGLLDLQVPRDAFITTVCKACLPPHYTLTVLNTSIQSIGIQFSNNSDEPQYNSMYGSESDYKQQVVAVGTPLATLALTTSVHNQGPVMLTAKNLQCMRALLVLSHCHGSILGSSWHLVLTTLQHLVWILGLKPSTGGSLKASRPGSDANAVITTAVIADLPVLSTMLSRLFESSCYLNDVALHHLIDALCKLSHEAMELAYCNREPSLFAVAKLLETGLVNLSRIEILWRPLTNHMLEVCQHPHIRMREWGVEAITYLVKAALQYKYQPPLKENQRLQTLLLSPLSELSCVMHGDVRQRQLECVLQVLHGSGETLSHGWPLVLNIVGAVSDRHGENLIRIAFQCLQLVVTDFLPLMPWKCLPLCLETTSKFGLQTRELNISLTAVGLMWNVADYFYQNKDKLSQSLSDGSVVFPDFPGVSEMPEFDKLWMCLFTKLGELCIDPRPAVRKSAGQTLFSTISAHGGMLNPSSWNAVLWQVLFPLMTKVQSLCNSASDTKVESGRNILIHHSRNTDQKQWAETQVSTLYGLARVFNTEKYTLCKVGDFVKAWSYLLEFLENAATNRNMEVSLAALRSLHELLYVNDTKELDNDNDISKSENHIEIPIEIWTITWKVWLRIATENNQSDRIPPQAFLTALVQIFPCIFVHIKMSFSETDLINFFRILDEAAEYPVRGEMSPTVLSDNMALTRLQEEILNCLELLQKETLTNRDTLNKFICPLFEQVLKFCRFVYCYPEQLNGSRTSDQKYDINFIAFGEKSILMAVNLYQISAAEPVVIQGNILKQILDVFSIPLAKRYEPGHQNTWKLCVVSLMSILSIGIPLARNNYRDFQLIWSPLGTLLENILFPKILPSKHQKVDEANENEVIDCQLVEFLKDEVLSQATNVPREFIMRIVVLLNKGSVLSTQNNYSYGYEVDSRLREEFAKVCFETLLQFSLVDGISADNGNLFLINSSIEDENTEAITGKLAVTALLHRFQEVVKKYCHDQSLTGKCPLPRYRMSEISFVLKAIATLIISLKKTPDKVNKAIWEQLVGLYPSLVQCIKITTNSPQVTDSLTEALNQYCDLLKSPIE
ncbi:protein MON2 homolog isoform X2 [Daktulosphaira vitifoliae]|uniref:protein MON2 homolog isoform X2 n=1 Tax=Daktulosphaira vitifoliae TaxID=58002 RepID=UPI0021AAE41F|nr:protein MON2 homolog isoform X2 [Daktulosphaira vitifoliae]